MALTCLMWKAYQILSSCQNYQSDHPAKPGKYYQQKNPAILTHQSLATTTVPSSTTTFTGALIYWGIHKITFQAPEIPSPLTWV